MVNIANYLVFMLTLLRVLLIVILLLVFLPFTINIMFVCWCCYSHFDASNLGDSLHNIILEDLGVVSETFRKTRVLINTS
jgi:hypothetical protein